jgi:hypothetical protein
MMYVRYFIATLVNLLFTAFSFLVAPILPLFAQSTGYLPGWLGWFQTPDNSLDAGWQAQGNYGTYLTDGTVPSRLARYWFRVLWLWRNPAYGFCVALGVAYDPSAWVIDTLEQSAGAITLLKAHTKDGRFFAYTTSSGWKLGYKLWWAMDANFNLLPTVPTDKNTGNKLPLCFTP